MSSQIAKLHSEMIAPISAPSRGMNPLITWTIISRPNAISDCSAWKSTKRLRFSRARNTMPPINGKK
ncbi:hypothetical protein D3C74_431290 [compost metagenome]